jgi:TPR repeat protein
MKLLRGIGPRNVDWQLLFFLQFRQLQTFHPSTIEYSQKSRHSPVSCSLLSYWFRDELFHRYRAKENQMQRRIRVLSALLAVVATSLSMPVPQVHAQSSNEKGFLKLQTKAERGAIDAEIELGHLYLQGNWVRQDASLAARWYERAAQAGNCEAQNAIGFLYQSGTGVPRDPARAAQWYQLAAASGSINGKVNLGLLYMTGMGVRKDIPLAMQLFEEGARKGDGRGAVLLGHVYEQGMLGTRDAPSAEKWFQLGAKLHNPMALYSLAQLYSADSEPRHDFKRATALLHQAVESGYVPAIYTLGLLLRVHPEIKQADGESKALLERAASGGEWRASVLLGISARDGAGVPVDKRSALSHFQIALLQGGEEVEPLVRDDIALLGSSLDKDERAAIASAARAWYMQHSLAPSFMDRRPNDAMYFQIDTRSETVQRTLAQGAVSTGNLSVEAKRRSNQPK